MNGRGRFILALVLVALTGFISLSYELLWVRLYSFVSAARAWAFGALLGSYLIGLALGSLWSLRYQKDGKGKEEIKAVAGFVAAGNLVGFLVVPVVSWLVVWVCSIQEDGPMVILWTLPVVVVAAALLGAALPLICHFAIPADEKVGAGISYLYLANIIGAGVGSLFTGFVLMDQFSMVQIAMILAGLGLVLAIGVAIFSGVGREKRGVLVAGVVVIAAVVFGGGPKLYDGVYERLQWKEDYRSGERFAKVVESRFGVVTIDKDNKIYGGGIFDGYLGTELWAGSWMVRPYFLSAVHEEPKEILTIGLSGGTWAQILVSHPQVEKVTAIEINAAYSERVIPDVEATKSILTNPKLEIIIDDGRRWLRRNPDRKFDAVVVNMTYHWREHATNLLSQEFMEEVKRHLNPGGIFLLNATGSDRVAKTAAVVFEDTNLLLNNVLASNKPLTFNKDRWRDVLKKYQIDGVPLFKEEDADEVEKIVSMIDSRGDREQEIALRILNREQVMEDGEGLDLITDDNLGEEY